VYPVSAASRAADVLNSVSSMLKRCVGFMMAKMVLRELMDPLIFLKFKSFLMKVQHASPPTTTTFLVFLKSFWINQSRTWWNFCFLALHLWIRSSFSSLISTSFLKTGIHWQSLYLLNMKKNPIVSSCTTRHVLVLILIRKLYWHIEC
jgi:hypothetical protein